MKNISKIRICFMIALVIVLNIYNNRIFGISNEFIGMIDMLGVPRYNANKEEINEDVYNLYKIFCYSSPEKYSGTNPNQRWKDSKYGLWNKLGGAYRGSGIRGEYMVIGKNYGGAVIHNYYFPLDTISPTTPDKWAYYFNAGALESWSDGKAYRFIEQRDHMKQSKLIFNDLSSRDNADNPAKFKEYNITPNSIGLDKAKLDTSSTWKTRGVISVKFMRDGNLRYAYFFTNPMSANAAVKANVLSESDSYTLKEDEKTITIPIEYKSDAINLTGYAKKDHIKEIKSIIYINDKKVGEISGSKTTNVGSRYDFVVSRQIPNLSPNNKFVIRADSYMYTEFAIDGVMKDSVQKTINVLVEPERVDPVKSYSIRQIEKQNLIMVVRPLAQTEITKAKESPGLIEAGRKLAVKINLNVDAKEITDLKALIGRNKNESINIAVRNVISKEIKEKVYNLNNYGILLDFEIPNNIPPTIYSWKSLRDKTESYFSARDETMIGERKEDPYTLFIELTHRGKIYNYETKIDIMDDYVSNTNYTIENQIINRQEISRVDSVESWMKDDI